MTAAMFFLARINDAVIFVLIFGIFLYNLSVEIWEYLLAFRFFVEILFDLAEKILLLDSATETVKSPALCILFKDQQYKNY